jgi:tetratricopeptide (TPR) repeat protein/predicted Ser/Thr protein kinase
MEDPNSKKGGRDKLGPQGVGVPAKGDSSASNSSFDPLEGATISDVPITPPPAKRPASKDASPPAKPPASKAAPQPTSHPNPDVTIVETPPSPPTPSTPKPTTKVVSQHQDATISDSLPPAPSSTGGRGLSGLYIKEAILQPGDLVGARYEILQLLGEGGMGAVYKALDREVERTVALKLIRPELASNPAILARFKQELLTAHQVTHKNVIRIYDIAEADGVKFITMEFVEGRDLRHILTDRGTLPVSESVEIIRQVCYALDAAHSAGIIHRDLKPQNIMQEDKTGRILVMDFGLARTIGGDGMTQTGALLGTIEYMSPEQSMGKALDQRSDIFAVGLIFYELLVGKTPYKADTAMASLLRRNQERAVPAAELDSSVPKALSDVVSKCLERDLESRYKSVQEILHDLEAFQGSRPTLASISLPAVTQVVPPKPATPWKWISVGGLAVVLVGGGLAVWSGMGHKGTAGAISDAANVPQLSLAIMPFHNDTNDPSLDWLGQSLADMLSTDVGQSAHMRMVSQDRVHQIFADLRLQSNTSLDPETIRRISEFSNADTVVWGRYAKFGDQIRIDATLHDLKRDTRTPLKIEAPSEKEIPATVDKLADMIRKNLSVSSDVLKELKASSFQPSTKSVSALRDYNQGIALQRDGKSLEAEKQFEAATKEDPGFALAYSKLAQTYIGLGYQSEAEKATQKAVELSQSLPTAERYLIEAVNAQIAGNLPDAIKAYSKLAEASPNNTDVQSALADLYERSGDLAKASEYNQKILAVNPKDISAILTMGRLAINSGKPQESLDPLNRALSLSVQLDNQEQKANSLHLIGLAYWRMNKPQESLRDFQEGLAIFRQIGQKRGIAVTLHQMAIVQAMLGDNKGALSSFQQAVELQRDIGDKRGWGNTLIDFGNFYDDHGDHDQALKMYKESLQIQRDVGDEILQANCLTNIGAVYYEKAQFTDALTYYQQALQLQEKTKLPNNIVVSLQNLADTSIKMGQYDQAISQYMRAQELWRSMNDARGGAITSSTLGTMLYYQGRFGAALSSKQDALKTFREMKDRTLWMVEIEAEYGQALTLAGRGEEAKTYLNEALSLARELKNEGWASEILSYQGDAAYYRGDSKSARALYEQALQTATRDKDLDRILIAKARLAKISAGEGSPQQAISSLRQLAQQADEQGAPNISIECSIAMGEAMIRSHEYAQAQQELQRTLLRADKMGLKPLSAQTHYQLANALRASGNQTEAQQHYRDTLTLLDGMRREPGADKILERSDFKVMHDEATHWAQAAKS